MELAENASGELAGTVPMKKPNLPRGCLLCGLMLLLLPLAAEKGLPYRPFDVVVLNNGTTFHGELVRQNLREVELKLKDSPLTLTFIRGDGADQLKEVLRKRSLDDAYRQAVQAAGTDPLKHTQLAQKCLASGLLKEYFQALVKAVALDPNMDLAVDDALDYFETVPDLEQELGTCLRLKKAGSRSPRLLLRLGEIYEHLGLDARALDAYRAAAEQEEDRQAIELRQATLLLKVGRTSEADKISRAILQKLPEDARTREAAGMLLFRKGNYARALEVLQSAAEEEKQSGRAQWLLGLVCLAMDLPTAALRHFEQIPQPLSMAEEVKLNRALAECAAGRPEEATAGLQAARNKTSFEYRLAHAILEECRGKIPALEFEKLYQALALENPANVPALCGLVRSKLAIGKPGTALDDIRAAATLNPNLWLVKALEGLCLLDAGKPGRAATAIDEALAFPTGDEIRGNADLLFVRGYAALLQKDLASAEKFFSRALHLNEKHPAASAGLARAFESKRNTASASGSPGKGTANHLQELAEQAIHRVIQLTARVSWIE